MQQEQNKLRSFQFFNFLFSKSRSFYNDIHRNIAAFQIQSHFDSHLFTAFCTALRTALRTALCTAFSKTLCTAFRKTLCTAFHKTLSHVLPAANC